MVVVRVAAVVGMVCLADWGRCRSRCQVPPARDTASAEADRGRL